MGSSASQAEHGLLSSSPMLKENKKLLAFFCAIGKQEAACLLLYYRKTRSCLPFSVLYYTLRARKKSCQRRNEDSTPSKDRIQLSGGSGLLPIQAISFPMLTIEQTEHGGAEAALRVTCSLAIPGCTAFCGKAHLQGSNCFLSSVSQPPVHSMLLRVWGRTGNAG